MSAPPASSSSSAASAAANSAAGGEVCKRAQKTGSEYADGLGTYEIVGPIGYRSERSSLSKFISWRQSRPLASALTPNLFALWSTIPDHRDFYAVKQCHCKSRHPCDHFLVAFPYDHLTDSDFARFDDELKLTENGFRIHYEHTVYRHRDRQLNAFILFIFPDTIDKEMLLRSKPHIWYEAQAAKKRGSNFESEHALLRAALGE